MFRFKNHVMLFVGGTSSCGNFHEFFCSSEQKLGGPRPSYAIKVSLLLQILHAFNEGFTLQSLVLWCFKMNTPHMLIHLWIM
jgi:hypothetical protein